VADGKKQKTEKTSVKHIRICGGRCVKNRQMDCQAQQAADISCFSTISKTSDELQDHPHGASV